MTARDVFRSKAGRVGIAQSVLWTALGVALLHYVPSFEKIFKDFGTKLPEMTIAVLRLGHFLGYYWYLALLPVLVWPFVNWGVVQLLSPNPISQRLWRVATWGLPCVCAAIVVFTLCCPLIVLIVRLQG